MTRLIALLAVMMMFSSATLAQDTKPAEKDDAKKTEATEESTNKYDLRPIFNKGDINRYLIVETNKTEQETMGNETSYSFTATTDQTLTCIDVDDIGSGIIEVRYDRIRYKGNMLGNEEEYDSKTDDFAEMSIVVKAMALMKDIPFTVIFDKNGQVTKVKGDGSYMKAIRKELGDDIADAYDKMGLDSIVGDSIKNSSRGIPAKEVGVSDTWKAKWEMVAPMIGMYEYNATFTFIAIDEKNGHNCAKIVISTDVSLKEDEDAQFKTEIASSQLSGTLWIDLETRILVYAEMENTIELKMTVGESVITTKTTATAKTTLKEDDIDEVTPENTPKAPAENK